MGSEMCIRDSTEIVGVIKLSGLAWLLVETREVVK